MDNTGIVGEDSWEAGSVAAVGEAECICRAGPREHSSPWLSFSPWRRTRSLSSFWFVVVDALAGDFGALVAIGTLQ